MYKISVLSPLDEKSVEATFYAEKDDMEFLLVNTLAELARYLYFDYESGIAIINYPNKPSIELATFEPKNCLTEPCLN